MLPTNEGFSKSPAAVPPAAAARARRFDRWWEASARCHPPTRYPPLPLCAQSLPLCPPYPPPSSVWAAAARRPCMGSPLPAVRTPCANRRRPVKPAQSSLPPSCMHATPHHTRHHPCRKPSPHPLLGPQHNHRSTHATPRRAVSLPRGAAHLTHLPCTPPCFGRTPRCAAHPLPVQPTHPLSPALLPCVRAEPSFGLVPACNIALSCPGRWCTAAA